MTIAIASKGKQVSTHFGHCDGCAVYSITNRQITAKEYIENPLVKLGGKMFCSHEEIAKNSDCACRFFSAFLLHEIKVDTVVTGEIGATAARFLSQRGIKVITGAEGEIEEYIQEFIKKALNQGEI